MSEGNINRLPGWDTQTPLCCPTCCQRHQGVGLGSGPQRRSRSQAGLPSQSQARPQVHNPRLLQGVILVPPVPWAGFNPWDLLQGPRGAAQPALPRPCHGLRSQCWGLGFKPLAAATTHSRRTLWGGWGRSVSGIFHSALRPHGPPRPLPALRSRPLTLAEQLQAPPLLAHLQAQDLLQHLLSLRLLCQPHALQLLGVQPQQCPAWTGRVGLRSTSGAESEGGKDTETQGDGERGEGQRKAGWVETRQRGARSKQKWPAENRREREATGSGARAGGCGGGGAPGLPAPLPRTQPPGTGDGVLGEGLHVDEVVVGTVLLEPLADILLAPQDHGPRQATQGGTCMIQAIVVRVQPALQGRGTAGTARW